MDPLANRNELTQQVIGLAMRVHASLGAGFVEFVYRNALIHELKKAGVAVEAEKSMRVYYDGVVVGEFAVDLLVDGWLIVELKAVSKLASQHEVQTVNYLTALGQEFGLLLNFGGMSLEVQRKYRRGKTKPAIPPDLQG